jgi:hypothetical protein
MRLKLGNLSEKLKNKVLSVNAIFQGIEILSVTLFYLVVRDVIKETDIKTGNLLFIYISKMIINMFITKALMAIDVDDENIKKVLIILNFLFLFFASIYFLLLN